MQGRSRDQRELLDAGSVTAGLLPERGVFAFLAEHRHRLFPDEMFADLFPSERGRPSVPAEVIASVLVLQALHGLSDREAAEALAFDLRWKAACGLAVGAASLHPTTLIYWRRRLAGSDRPHRIFEVVAAVIAETGVVGGKTRRALDSTVLDDAVATQDTVTQLIAAVRRVGRDVPGGAELITACCFGHDYSKPGKPQIAWDDPAARDELVSALVGDALRLLDRLAETDLDARASEAVALLALTAGQDVEPAEGSDGTDGRWRIARRVAPERVISTVDPDARHAHKTVHQRRDGYKAHAVVEPDTGLITATRLTRAAGADNSDAAVGVDLLGSDTTLPRPQRSEQAEPDQVQGEQLEGKAGSGVQVLGDSAYGTGDALAEFDRAGHTPIIKPWPLRPAVPGGFTLDDFTIDYQAGTATCPNAVTRPITPSRNVIFGAVCGSCPLRARCTTSTTGRTVHLHPHEALQRAHRARAATAEFQATYRTHRPMVERSIAWLTRGNRRVPFRGVAANNAWLHTRVAGLNLRRLLTLGLHHSPTGWALA